MRRLTDAGDFGGDCRGQRGAADHAGPTPGQRHGCRWTVADSDQPGDLVRQRHAGGQSERHLELYAGAQRRHLGDVQLCGDRRRCGAGGDQRHARHHPGERRASHHAGDFGGDCRGQRGAADHAGPTPGQRHGCRWTVADSNQPGDLVRQRHAGGQSERHLELYAGAQRRQPGDVQLCGDRRRCGAGGHQRHARYHPGQRDQCRL